VYNLRGLTACQVWLEFTIVLGRHADIHLGPKVTQVCLDGCEIRGEKAIEKLDMQSDLFYVRFPFFLTKKLQETGQLMRGLKRESVSKIPTSPKVSDLFPNSCPPLIVC
jgi:hypothetical protein